VTGHDIVFLLVGLITAGAAVLTVTSKNLVHAALFLAATLSGIAGVFLVLHADFLALVQLVVYVGAVAVLFLFGLMLTRAPIGREALDSQNRALGMGGAGGLFVVLTALIVGAFRDAPRVEVTGTPIAEIGISIFRDWVLPIEVLSMLLLAALIGAILINNRAYEQVSEFLEAKHFIDPGHRSIFAAAAVEPVDTICTPRSCNDDARSATPVLS
jgi:NADH-quinone oxidoreductase subunit J